MEKQVRGKAKQRKIQERRFEPQLARVLLVLGGVGAAMLGAGVAAQWLSETEYSFAPWLVGSGAVALAATVWLSDRLHPAVRVGDAGVALDDGKDLERMLWCDMKRLSLTDGQLELSGVGTPSKLRIAVFVHPRAVAWVLREAASRVQSALDVRPSVLRKLPAPKDSDGRVMEVEGLQITGRSCASSGTPLNVEEDVRLCPKCLQTYHMQSVPKTCVTCGNALGKTAFRL